MNLSAIDATVAQNEDPVDVTILQQNGVDPFLAADGTPATIGVVGSESKRYKAARHHITRRMMRGKITKLEPEDLHRNRVDQAAAAVVRWHGWERDGDELPCTPENVKELLRIADFILEQVEEGITGHADFFGSSSSS